MEQVKSEPQFAWYFGYGSNMNQAQLKAGKGISPLESHPAQLNGWRLVFNLKPILKAFGCMGNIIKDENGTVHGVLHKFTMEDLLKMDKFESTYKRIPLCVTTYDEKKIEANVYVIFPDHSLYGPEGSPSLRYKTILVNGAKSSKLQDHYIKFLEGVEPCPFEYDPNRKHNVPNKLFTRAEVRANPMYMSHMGYVFDLTEHENVRNLFNSSTVFSGKAREFVSLRLMPADGEVPPPAIPEKFADMTPSQLTFLDNWLQAMELEWTIVGTCPLPNDMLDI